MVMFSLNDKDASIKHMKKIDRAQDARLQSMFEELKQCNIEELSLIRSRKNKQLK